jgi:anti-repressor protein
MAPHNIHGAHALGLAAPELAASPASGLKAGHKDEARKLGSGAGFREQSKANTNHSPGALVLGQAATAAGSTMTSSEIAELLQCRHDNVKRTVDNLVARGTIVRPQTEDGRNTDALGRARSSVVYLLDKRSSYVVVAQLSPEFTGALVDRWQHLEDLHAKPAADPMALLQDPAIVRGLLLTYADKVMALEHAVQAQAPKVVYADALLGAEGDILIGDAAKALNIPVMKLRRALREKQVLNANGQPAALYVTKGYFRVKLQAGSNGMVFRTAMVTMRGIEWLRRFWNRIVLAQAAAGAQESLL